MAWGHYASTAAVAPPLYVLRKATEPPPDGGELAGTTDGHAIFVLASAAWQAQRSMRPRTSLGRSWYVVPRNVLFPRTSAMETRTIIDVQALVEGLLGRR